jgi:AcrR family transcriptional regulator
VGLGGPNSVSLPGGSGAAAGPGAVAGPGAGAAPGGGGRADPGESVAVESHPQPADRNDVLINNDQPGRRPRRPSLGGGIPAQGRELGVQGRLTVRRLLDAGLAEFDERGFQAVRVDDVVRRAKTSHGTFYLYFANKDDLFRTLLQDALFDMEIITDEFPIVTSNPAGRAALRSWIHKFTDTYAAHATVIRILSQADIVGEEVYGDGLRLLFRLSEAIAQGMTAARRRTLGGVAATAAGAGAGELTAGGLRSADGSLENGVGAEAGASDGDATASGRSPDGSEHAELTALACLMMLERINYLLSVEVRLPKDEMIDRLSAIIYAAFHTP